MRPPAFRLSSLIVLISVCACSSNEKASTADQAVVKSDTEPDAHEDAKSPGDADAATDAPADTVEDAATAACTNAADHAKLDSQEERDLIVSSAQQYVMGCNREPNAGQCIMDKLVANNGISSECAGCFVDSLGCVAINCVELCLDDRTSKDCVACQELHCDEDFFNCTGLKPL